MDKHKVILVPYDFTEEADCALNHAASLAALHHGKVYLTHILDKKSVAHLKSEHKSENTLKAELQAVADKAAPEGVEIIPYLKGGEIFHDISAAAEDVAADLIIFGT